MNKPNPNPFRECKPSRRRAPESPRLSTRLPSFIGARAKAEKVLRKLRVAVIGTGSVGMPVAIHLARLQICELWLVDPQPSCKAESVLTHPLNRWLKQPKAAVTARLCRQISPATRVYWFVGRVQDLPPDALAGVDLWVMATDNLPAEIEAGSRCLRLGRKLVHAALHGESLTLQVRVFANTDASGPCPACAFGAEEWRQLVEEVRFSCDGARNGPAAPQISGPPTRSTSHLCSLAADVAINQILRLVLQLGDSVDDTIVEYCGFTNRTVTARLARNPACRCDHVRFGVERSPTPLMGRSFEQLAKAFGFNPADASLTLSVGGACWIEKGLCQCGQAAPVRRFLRAGQQRAGSCARCRGPLRVQPFYALESVSAAVLGKVVTAPLNRLGAGQVPWIVLRDAARAVLVQDPTRAVSMP